MKKNISIIIGFVALFLMVINPTQAQVYNMADENGNTILTCGGGFTDSDAFNGDIYINNEEYMVTFCSDVPGECIQVDFTSFDVPDPHDWLYIWDGADTTIGTYVGKYNNPFGNNTNSLTAIYPDGFESTTGCLTFVFISDGDMNTGTGWDAAFSCTDECGTCYDGIQNGMETDIDCGGVCEPCPEPINIANGGTHTTCDNIFVDSGGLTGDYSDNEDYTVTICSDNPNPNYCLLVNFVQWQVTWGENFYVYDGPVSGQNLIGTYGNGTSPGSILASGGCLTFRFESSTWSTDGGWLATIDCIECADEPIPTLADCLGALPICSSYDTIPSTFSGSGSYGDLVPPNPCNVTDNNSLWYVFDIETDGVLNFNLNSLPSTNDFDWLLMDVTGIECSDISNATVVHCNSANLGPTGISSLLGGTGTTNTVVSYNEDYDVIAGESYALMISRVSSTIGFDLDFSASTAEFSDTFAPTIIDVEPSCANNVITVTFDEQVDCSTVSTLDFLILGSTGNFNVTSLSSDWCDSGLDGGVEYELLLDGVLDENETYALSIESVDFGITDLCGNVNNSESFGFTTGLAMTLTTDITPSDCADTQPTGGVNIIVNGGAEPFYIEMGTQYGYDDSVFVFNNLPAGVQQIDVYDDIGCHAIFFIDVPNSNSNMDNDITIANVSCLGGDGSIDVSTTGGIGYGPWDYDIFDSTGTLLASIDNIDHIFLDGLDVGEYTISIFDHSPLSPCPDLQTVIVGVPDTIIVSPVMDSTICYFGQTYLSATVEGGTGSPFTINWDDGVNQFNSGPSQLITQDSLITSTVYSVYAEDDLGCTSEIEQVLITVNDLLSFDMSPDQVICGGSEMYIGVTNIQGGEGFGYEVRWDIGGGLIIDQDSVLIIPTEPSMYCAHVSDQCETPDVDSCITISPTLYVPVTFDIVSDTASCPPFLASFQNTTDPLYVGSANWDFGDEGSSNNLESADHIFEESGEFNVTLTIIDPDGCVFDTTIVDAISIHPVPVADFSISPEEPTLINSTVQFVNESEGAVESYWVFDTINQLGEAFEDNPFFVFPDQIPDEYFNRLSVTSELGCTNYITKMLVIEEDLTLYVPNSFSPNGDGKNDYFYVKSKELDPVFFHLIIFDRWGKVVFESNDIRERWNGSVQGSTYYAQPGAFAFNLAYKISNSTEKKEITGTITLLK